MLNVHPPPSLDAYVHRVGRTGRAGQAGAALTLFGPGDMALAKQLETTLSGDPAGLRQDCAHCHSLSMACLGRVSHVDAFCISCNASALNFDGARRAAGRPSAATQNGAATPGEAAGDDGDDNSGPALQPFTRLTKPAVEALRYRGEDILRSLTKTVVKEVGSSRAACAAGSPARQCTDTVRLAAKLRGSLTGCEALLRCVCCGVPQHS